MVGGAASVYQLPKKTRHVVRQRRSELTNHNNWWVSQRSSCVCRMWKLYMSGGRAKRRPFPAIEMTHSYIRGVHRIWFQNLRWILMRPNLNRPNKFTNSGISILVAVYQIIISATVRPSISWNHSRRYRSCTSIDSALPQAQEIAIDPECYCASLSKEIQVESTGSTARNVSRKIIVFQQYKAPSSIFDSSIYSQSSFGR